MYIILVTNRLRFYSKNQKMFEDVLQNANYIKVFNIGENSNTSFFRIPDPEVDIDPPIK